MTQSLSRRVFQEDTPIIVRIEGQSVDHEYALPTGGHITVINNVGVDSSGQRWLFKSEHRTGLDGMTVFSSYYGYMKA